MAEVCTAAVTSIPGAELADIMLRRDDMVFSLGATSPLAATLDAVQLHLGPGPCLQAANGEDVVRADDFGSETRWPRWCAEATALGVGSAMSYRLYSRRAQTAGAAAAARAAAVIAASAWGTALLGTGEV